MAHTNHPDDSFLSKLPVSLRAFIGTQTDDQAFSPYKVLPVGGQVSLVCFSPGQDVLCCVVDQRTIQVWNPHTGIMISEMQEHKGIVRQMGFSRDGSMFYSCDQFRRLKLWDTRKWACVRTLRTYSSRSREMFFCAGEEGLRIITAGRDVVGETYLNRLKVWDLSTGICNHIVELELYRRVIGGVAALGDGRTAVLYNNYGVSLLQIPAEASGLLKFSDDVLQAGFVKGVDGISFTRYAERIALTDLNDMKVAEFNWPVDRTNLPVHVVCDPDRHFTCFVAGDRLDVYDSDSGACMQKLHGDGAIGSAAFSTDGLLLACPMRNGELDIYAGVQDLAGDRLESVVKHLEASSLNRQNAGEDYVIARLIMNVARHVGAADGDYSMNETEVFHDFNHEDITINRWMAMAKVSHENMVLSTEEVVKVLALVEKKEGREKLLLFKRFLLELAAEIAQVEGGFMGITSSISRHERKAIEELEQMLA